MVCHDCKKRESQVSLTQIVNNVKTSLSLCKECAGARGFHSPLDNVPFPLAEILAGLTSSVHGAIARSKKSGVKCPDCGLTFDEFTQQGRFGCGRCYSTFRSDLEPIMRKIHGASLHRGNTPEVLKDGSSDANTLPIQEEERLESGLTKAIEAEDFERAAEIRDKLKTLREKLEVQK